VYDISVLSNIPLAVMDLLAPTAPPQRLRPLFSIGVHDIPFLEDDLKASTSQPVIIDEDEDGEDLEDSGRGWIACTTDDILTMKNSLYDVLITLPHSYSTNAKDKVWPKIESPRGTEIKATQRDLRRYRALKWGLSRAAVEPHSPALGKSNATNTSNGDVAGPSSSGPAIAPDGPLLDTSDTDPIVEPPSWSALAYSGFMWWASAGERRIDTEDESVHDSILLDGFGNSADPQTPRSARSRSQSSLSQMLSQQAPGDQSARREMAIIAYFHRLTTRILTTLSDIIDATNPDSEEDGEETALHDSNDADGEEGPPIPINSGDIAKMGLDEWSANDRAFIVEVAKAYFGREAQIEGTGIDICGIRIC
jgi:hypothetical protein